MEYGNGPSNATSANLQGQLGRGYDNPNTQVKATSIIEQLNMQEKALEMAHNALDVLIDRLHVILGPVSAAGKEANAPQPTPSQLSQRVPMHTRSIDALAARISEITGRVEL